MGTSDFCGSCDKPSATYFLGFRRICSFTQFSTMRAFIFSSVLLALATADTCSDCTAVVSTIAARLSSEESIAAQLAILVGGLCPGAENPAECEAALPRYWPGIAAILWPGYWDPTADWMCADICAAPEDTVMTCDSCKMGIQSAIDQLLEVATLDAIVDILANGEFCASMDDYCPTIVDVVIRQGLPMLAAAGADADFSQACNAAVEGTCPAKLRLF